MHRAVHRISTCLAVLPCVAACVPPSWGAQDSNTDHAKRDVAYDFNWRLSGERAVAPLQVFDDGRRTWLHFAPGQPLPAIFAVGRGGERPVPYQRRDPYVVIDGVWPALIMRGGSLRAMARRQAGAPVDEAPHFAAQPVAATAAASAGTTGATGATGATGVTGATGTIGTTGTTASAAPVRTDAPALGMAQPHIAPTPAMGKAQPRVASTPAFHAEMTDVNLRRVLARWAGLAGWKFDPEHWDVDVDIPLAGGASFGDDFKQAVRALVSATEMAERPLQPCFYANRVLRVVSYAHACDRAATREAAT